jgi:hypothetical protein
MEPDPSTPFKRRRTERYKIGVLIAATVLCSGCDPGWKYKTSSDAAGLRGAPDQPVAVRGEASVFGGRLTVRLELLNHTSHAFNFDPGSLRVTDTDGNVLVAEDRTTSCPPIPPAVSTLRPKDTCSVDGRFVVYPLRGFRMNPSLRTIRLSVGPLMHGDEALPIQVAMEESWTDRRCRTSNARAISAGR